MASQTIKPQLETSLPAKSQNLHKITDCYFYGLCIVSYKTQGYVRKFYCYCYIDFFLNVFILMGEIMVSHMQFN